MREGLAFDLRPPTRRLPRIFFFVRFVDVEPLQINIALYQRRTDSVEGSSFPAESKENLLLQSVDFSSARPMRNCLFVETAGGRNVVFAFVWTRAGNLIFANVSVVTVVTRTEAKRGKGKIIISQLNDFVTEVDFLHLQSDEIDRIIRCSIELILVPLHPDFPEGVSAIQ